MMNWKKLYRLLLIGGTMCASLQASAFEIPAGSRSNSFIGVEVNDISLTADDNLAVNLTMDFSQVNLPGNTELILTPAFINGTDTLRFDPMSVAGRNRWYYNLRNGIDMPVMICGWGRNKGISNLDLPVSDLNLTTPMQPWLQEAVFTIETEVRGCANCLKTGPTEEWLPIARNELVTHAAFIPDFIYVTPVAEVVKVRDISARAYIDFPVNRTEIYPDYRRNPQELAKIRATIDSISNDKDIKVTSLHISGTASPEGSYQNNVRLAKGRTEALKNYVQNLYHFPAGFITTSYEPVDWQGLKTFLMQVLGMRDDALSKDSIRQDQLQNIGGATMTMSEIRAALPNAEEILNIVNGSLPPEQRNANIKKYYSTQYAWLLANVYPALRHSDYRINFEIRSFTEPTEIIEIMQTQPQKLSLSELFVAANSQPEGSDLYNRAFELAVVMFPDDETANLNAGVNALKRGDMVSAEKYLKKAGNSAEADYNRAMLLQMQGRLDEAIALLEKLTETNQPNIQERAAVALASLLESLQPDTFTFRLM